VDPAHASSDAASIGHRRTDRISGMRESLAQQLELPSNLIA